MGLAQVQPIMGKLTVMKRITQSTQELLGMFQSKLLHKNCQTLLKIVNNWSASHRVLMISLISSRSRGKAHKSELKEIELKRI